MKNVQIWHLHTLLSESDTVAQLVISSTVLAITHIPPGMAGTTINAHWTSWVFGYEKNKIVKQELHIKQTDSEDTELN